MYKNNLFRIEIKNPKDLNVVQKIPLCTLKIQQFSLVISLDQLE